MKTLVAVVALLAAQSGPVSPLEGLWRTGFPQSLDSRGMTTSGVSFAVQPGRVTITRHVVLRSDGRTVSSDQTVETDGKPHQYLNDPTGSTVVAKWLSQNVLEITRNLKRPDGIYTTLVTYTVSADQKALTERLSDLPAKRYTSETAFYR